MLQNTKARHIPSGRVETETTQKQNLSLAVSQAEWAPECQEQAWKGGGAEQQKRAFLKGQRCIPGKRRVARAARGVGMLSDFFKGQQGAAVPLHTPPSCSMGSGSAPKKSEWF